MSLEVEAQLALTHTNVDHSTCLTQYLLRAALPQTNRATEIGFRLNRFSDIILAWLWPHRGVIDIFATLAIETLSDYIKAEFVLVCRTMWEDIIACDVDRVGLQQAESVAERGTDVYMLQQSDKDRYHAQIKSFHVDYNKAHPTKRVEILDEIRVSYNTIDTANGDSGPVADKCIFRVNAKVRAAEIAAVDVNAAY